jgi:hypothetical protein
LTNSYRGLAHQSITSSVSWHVEARHQQRAIQNDASGAVINRNFRQDAVESSLVVAAFESETVFTTIAHHNPIEMVAVNWLVSTALAAAILGFQTAQATDHQIPLTIAKQKPNIVFILTDDQDIHMNSLDYVPLIKEHLLDRGTFYRRHFCTIAVCCPSRVNIWTGRAGHNTNVTDLVPPYGDFLLNLNYC